LTATLDYLVLFRDIDTKSRKLLVFLTLPLFNSPAQEKPLEILDDMYSAKTRGMALPYCENFIIIASTVLTYPPAWQWQTDGRTEGRITYTRHTICSWFVMFKLEWYHLCGSSRA